MQHHIYNRQIIFSDTDNKPFLTTELLVQKLIVKSITNIGPNHNALW